MAISIREISRDTYPRYAEIDPNAADWAKKRGCVQLRVECQNVNVAACRFYAKHCTLGGIERYGYATCADVAHEAMLLWYRDL